VIYPYRCPSCSKEFEVVKSVRDIDVVEYCPQCADIGVRYISRTSFFGASDWDKQEYNVGLGCVTKNSKHRDKIAKERGLVEIGNEDCEKTMASQDKKLNDRIEEATKPAYDALEYGLKKDYLSKR
jgi:putative FmdB family regulatory protein